MTSDELSSYKVFRDKDSKSYIRLYFNNVEDLRKVSAVDILFNENYRPVSNGNLYSFQRLKEEKDRAFDNGYEDGYAEGYTNGLSDSTKPLEDVTELENRIAELETEILEREEKAYKRGWFKHQQFVEQKEAERQAEEEKVRLEKSRRVAVGGGRKEALTAEQKAQIRSWHELGKSYREIEQLMGYKASHVTIGKVVKGEL